MTSEDLCKKRLHPMTDDNILWEKGRNKAGERIMVRRCKACRRAGGRAAVKLSRGERARELSVIFAPIMRTRFGWEEFAECKGTPVETFIDPKDPDAVKEEFCSRCPVRALCLAQGLAYGDVSGIWGGVFLPREILTVDQDKLIEEIE